MIIFSYLIVLAISVRIISVRISLQTIPLVLKHNTMQCIIKNTFEKSVRKRVS